MIGIYETIYCRNNQIFNFDAHYSRLKKSAKVIKNSIPETKNRLISTIKSELTAKNLPEARVRLTLANSKISIECQEIVPNSSNILTTFKAERPIPRLKCTDRTAENQALQHAKQNNAVDSLLINSKNQITEGSISNFFAIQNGQILTTQKNILLGTTRKIVLQLAKELAIPIKITNLKLEQIPQFDGAFITNSIKRIVPIYQIDQHQIPKNQITDLLIKHFPTNLYQ